MDAEPIVLPKICAVRSHFRVSIRHAISSVDRGNIFEDESAEPQITSIRAGMPKGRVANPLKVGAQVPLPPPAPWPNLGNMPFRYVYPAGLPCCCMRFDAGDSGDWPTG